MKKRQKHYLSVIIILFLCIGIGYAYLSSTLNSSFQILQLLDLTEFVRGQPLFIQKHVL